jgi:hypothetical protein
LRGVYWGTYRKIINQKIPKIEKKSLSYECSKESKKMAMMAWYRSKERP